jgi:hypothetical protein
MALGILDGDADGGVDEEPCGSIGEPGSAEANSRTAT